MKEDKDLSEIIEKMADNEYPVIMVRDYDGDWKDVNAGKREAFAMGCCKIINLIKQK